MGRITEAMRRSVRGPRRDDPHGRTVRSASSSAVAVVRGVTLESGETIEARIVVSNADPRRTFLGCSSARALDAEFVRDVEAIRMAGPCAKVNFVLAEEPRVNGMPPTARRSALAVHAGADARAGRGLLQRRATRRHRARPLGRLRARIECGSVARPAGRHMLTCFVQFVPYQPNAGGWSAQREKLGDRVTEIIAAYAPNVPGRSSRARGAHAARSRAAFGITEGNIFHGDPSLDQLLFRRPVPGWAHYRTPIAGLYLCGAGTHPGGGVTGAPGHNAAQ
jgi:phytoene dehydrogenase-like protein